MESPAFEMQYSPRLTLETDAEIEVTNTTARKASFC